LDRGIRFPGRVHKVQIAADKDRRGLYPGARQLPVRSPDPNGGAQEPRADGVSNSRHEREWLRQHRDHRAAHGALSATEPFVDPALTLSLGIAFHKAIIDVCAKFEEEQSVSSRRQP